MKHIPSAFRRRKKQIYSAAATAAVVANADANEPTQLLTSPVDSERPIGRISIIQGNQPPIKVIQFADKGRSSATAVARADNVSPITIIDRPDPEATMKTPERVLLPVPRDNNDKRNPTPYNNVDSKSFGADQHLSAREQMWYKNQMYLLAKQQQQQNGMPSSRVESKSMAHGDGDRYNDGGGVDRHRYSPRGVDEFENHPWKRSDSDYDDYTYSDDGDTRTNLSTKLMEDDEDSCTTTQYTSALEDDTRTYLSSLLFDDDDDANSDSSDVFDDVDVALDSAISGYTTNATESESLFTSLDDGTSMPYVFELKDDGAKQRPKYQLGVGHNPEFTGHRKSRRSSSKSKRTDLSTSETIPAWPKRDRRKMNSKVDASSEDYVECPLLQVLLEEVSGTYKDAKLALDQVLHAFCISPDNLDSISDKLSDAKVELLEMYHQRGPRRDHTMNYSFQHVR
ncbi:hypothetical protein ACHAXH_002828 [Discostella pseudostelligera]